MATIATLQRGSCWLVTTLVAGLCIPACLPAQVLGTPFGDPPHDAWRGMEGAGPVPSRFKSEQLRFPRVRQAYDARAHEVHEVLARQGIDTLAEVFFRVFKREQLLEVWGRDTHAREFVLVETYPVCGTSGTLGPKREQGDEQIPEGFYSIDLFNPVSQFHLSLRVDFPNAVDRARSNGLPLGGDIFIHGGCATVGCVPVTDEWMEKVYLMAVAARAAGQDRIPVHLFPMRLDDDGFAWLAETYGADHPDLPFWTDLRRGYDAFERTRRIPHVGQDNGRYTITPGTVSSR